VLEETLSVTENRFGEHVVVDLRPGSSSQDVAESNKDEDVDLVVAHRIRMPHHRAIPRIRGGARRRPPTRPSTHLQRA
jgi:hypothetical protein